MTTVLQSSKIALVLNSAVVTSNVEAAIKHVMKYEPVQTYLCQRNIWTLEMFHLIYWPSFGRYFKSIPMAKRIKVAKYMYMTGKTQDLKKQTHQQPIRRGSVRSNQPMSHAMRRKQESTTQSPLLGRKNQNLTRLNDASTVSPNG